MANLYFCQPCPGEVAWTGADYGPEWLQKGYVYPGVLQRVGKTKFCHLADWTQFYRGWYPPNIGYPY